MVEERIPWIPYPLLFPFLILFASLYACLIRARNILYDHALLRRHKIGVRVVSVGNLTVGGTGKTPLVHRIAAECLRRGHIPAVVSRGYGSRSAGPGDLNDEGLLLSQSLEGLSVVQNPDRVAAARKAVSEDGADFLIMDDGFQHRRLARDLDLVTLDATRPFGYGRVLPAGLLREPLPSLERADAIVLTRCDQVDSYHLEAVETRIEALAPRTPVFRTHHAPLELIKMDGSESMGLEILAGGKVYLFSGIANPRAFERTVSGLGADVGGSAVYPDHHHYREKDMEKIREEARGCGADRIITTAKDGVKIRGFTGTGAFWILEVRLEFLEDEEVFWSLVFDGGRRPE
jgi:tetraacyldisaccharide 4'-kinase